MTHATEPLPLFGACEDWMFWISTHHPTKVGPTLLFGIVNKRWSMKHEYHNSRTQDGWFIESSAPRTWELA